MQTPITLPIITESLLLRELIIPTSELSAGTAAGECRRSQSMLLRRTRPRLTDHAVHARVDAMKVASLLLKLCARLVRLPVWEKGVIRALAETR